MGSEAVSFYCPTRCCPWIYSIWSWRPPVMELQQLSAVTGSNSLITTLWLKKHILPVMGKSQNLKSSSLEIQIFKPNLKSWIESHTKILNPQTPNLKSNLKSRNNKKTSANIFQFYWFRPMVTIGISIFRAALLRALISPFKASHW